jgi:hypothetical protein
MKGAVRRRAAAKYGATMNYRAWIPVLVGIDFLRAWVCYAAAAEVVPHRLYEMTTETVMPHLEENLRYATVTEKRCLDTHDLSRAFWMLGKESLQDCELLRTGETATAYVLKCAGGHGTTGNASWQFGPNSITGVLNVRLGGKNMTFYQRITAKPLGACE